MFKKTRRKIVAAIMSILVVLFIGILAGIYGASYYETARENRKMLQEHARFFSVKELIDDGYVPNDLSPNMNDLMFAEPPHDNSFGNKFQDKPEYELASFYSVVATEDGMVVAENVKAAYTDEELLEIAEKVYQQKQAEGTIENLSFYQADKGKYTLIVFKDNSIVNSSRMTLFKYTLLFGGIALIVFFFLSRQLAKMIVRPLEKSYKKQKQFISDAGHELKTPISVVNVNAELLAREIGENQWLSNIQYENERMGALVTQLLELARTEDVIPQMETIDFGHLVKGEALLFESVVFEKGMTLNCDIVENMRVLGNATQLGQLTAILLDNAVKHGEGRGEILLSLKKEHNCAVLSVINDGQEILPEDCKNLFERFYRVDTARNDKDKHYGLGLSIAKAIVTTHHGKIDVRCRNGKVEFVVRIPLKK